MDDEKKKELQSALTDEELGEVAGGVSHSIAQGPGDQQAGITKDLQSMLKSLAENGGN